MSAQWLDVIVPVRNPGEPIKGTIESLIAQTDRQFGVLLSDNYSASGVNRIEEARAQMEAVGIQVRYLRPPEELGRVEHWNWAHFASEADWLKPLFVGDTLEPEYVARLRERVTDQPAARLVRCGHMVVTPTGSIPPAQPPLLVERFSPREMLSHFPQHGNWLGGPINFAYERTAFRGAGGFSTQLPAAADLHLFVTLALRYGIEFLHEPLATFFLHEERFSHGIRNRRVNVALETWFILRQARAFCLENELPWQDGGVASGTWKQVTLEYWHPLKRAIKRRLGLRESWEKSDSALRS